MIKRRVQKNEIDMLHGSLFPKTIMYALPLAATGILQQLFNATGIAIVGRFVGKTAMAAVGANAPVISLLVNLFLGISLGSNVVIANFIGREDRESVHQAVHTSILIAVLSGILLLAVGEVIASPIMSLMGVPVDVYDMAVLYLKVYFLGMPFILLYNFEASIFRAVGDTRSPLYILLLSGIVNVALNMFFVIKLGMTVDGAAIATVISNAVSSIVLFIMLSRRTDVITIRLRDLRIYGKVLRKILRIGIPSGIQTMMFSFANVIIQSAVNSLGSTVMAASSASYNIEIFAYYVLNSYNQACTTFVGQNNGAGQYNRCRKILKICLLQDLLSVGSMCAVILIFSNQLLGLFNGDPEVIETGKIRLVYIFIGYAASFIAEVLSGYLRGFGISALPAVVALIGIVGTRLVYVMFIFYRAPSFSTLMFVYPLSLWIYTAAIVVLALLLHPARRAEKKAVSVSMASRGNRG